MEQLLDDTKLHQATADEIAILFYNSNESAAYTLAVREYTRCFGLSPFLTHCKLVFRERLYEVTAGGTYSRPFDRDELGDPRLSFVWTCALKNETQEDRDRNDAIRFMLEQDVASNRRWSARKCMRYLANYTCSRGWDVDTLAESSYALEEATVKRQPNGFLSFHLPFTCATQASNVLAKLIGEDGELLINSHLPSSVFLLCLACADNNYGFMYQAGEII